MKTAVLKRIRRPAYPNAADHKIYLHKLVDGALTMVTAVGTVTALIFLIML